MTERPPRVVPNGCECCGNYAVYCPKCESTIMCWPTEVEAQQEAAAHECEPAEVGHANLN